MKLRIRIARWLCPEAFVPNVAAFNHCYIKTNGDEFEDFLVKHFPIDGNTMNIRGLFICPLSRRVDEEVEMGNAEMANRIAKMIKMIKMVDSAEVDGFLGEVGK